jgi:hypothetical protein
MDRAWRHQGVAAAAEPAGAAALPVAAMGTVAWLGVADGAAGTAPELAEGGCAAGAAAGSLATVTGGTCKGSAAAPDGRAGLMSISNGPETPGAAAVFAGVLAAGWAAGPAATVRMV